MSVPFPRHSWYVCSNGLYSMKLCIYCRYQLYIMATHEGKVIFTFVWFCIAFKRLLFPPTFLPLSLTPELLYSFFQPLPSPNPLSSTFSCTYFLSPPPSPKQALFHQPSFRRMVLEYSPPSNPTPDDTTAQQPHNLCVTFVQELRSLFSLMIHSQKKYVDPKAVVKVCRSLHRSSTICSVRPQRVRTYIQSTWYLRTTYICVCKSLSMLDCQCAGRRF